MENATFQACSTIITKKLDVISIYPTLNSHHLLTQKDQQFVINQMYKDHDKIAYLLYWLPRKADGWYDKFIQSLHQSSANTGHGNITNNVADTLLHKLKEFNTDESAFVSTLIPVSPTINSGINYHMNDTIAVEPKKCFDESIFLENDMFKIGLKLILFDDYCLPQLENSFHSMKANSQSCRSVYAVCIQTDNKKYLVSYSCSNNKVCYNKHH